MFLGDDKNGNYFCKRANVFVARDEGGGGE